MSVSHQGISLWLPLAVRPVIRRLALATVSVIVVATGLGLLAWLVFSIGLISKPTPPNPFGITLREVGSRTTGIAGVILAIQTQFYAALTVAIQAMKSEHAAVTSLASIGFLYGIFHAAGPGHGKGVISAYIVAGKRSLWRGLSLSLAAALLQASVAVTLVGVLAAFFNATTTSIEATARAIEIVSFAGISVIGAVVVWWKAGQFEIYLEVANHGNAVPEESRLPASALSSTQNWRELGGVVLAAGIRPCTGALLLLIFSLSQGLLLAGVIGAFAMAIGTAITTGILAALAVFAKTLLMRFVGSQSKLAILLVGAIELLAAAFILVLGCTLLTGFWSGGLPNLLD